jgi:NADPH:quinone reductase-like Zn-dependent oxidoreductase
MRAAGITEFGAPVQPLALPDPAELRADEVLIDVRYSGVGHWDQLAAAGDWDLGARPPMALGVEAAGVIARTGGAPGAPQQGEAVMTHSLPLRWQGTWAEQFVAAAADVAVLPAGMPLEVAGAAPVPLLTADKALRAAGEALRAAGRAARQAPGPDRLDQLTVLVSGAAGVTGLVLVQLAAHLGGRVIATAGQRSGQRVRAAGAAQVIDYRSGDWPGQVRALTGGTGADLAVNAVPGGAATALRAVRDGGALVTITSDPPPAERGITVCQVYVAPDGQRLAMLGGLLGAGVLRVTPGADYPLSQPGPALAQVARGTGGQTVLLRAG